MTSSVNTIVTGIWCEILGVDEIPETASFYDLGGTSLEAEQIASRISDAFAVDIRGGDILRHELLGTVIAAVTDRNPQAPQPA
jgi:acyl carrier protein